MELKTALLRAGFRPSLSLIFENKLKSMRWFIQHNKFDNAENERNKIISFCKKKNLNIPEEVKRK